MSLSPGSKVLLRLRGPWQEWPWLANDRGGPPSFAMSSDDGWKVHDAKDDSVMLESLSAPRSQSARWLHGRPKTRQVVLAKRDITDATGLRWRAHPGPSGTFMLESLSKYPGPKWIAKGQDYAELTERPADRSLIHELVALPAADVEAIHQREQDHDYSHLAAFAVGPNGRPTDLAPPAPPKPLPGTLTPDTPRERAADDPVALELIAALQPSFDDGACGPAFSDYASDDPRRISWPHNIVSLDTVALPTGVLRLHKSRAKHEPPPRELAKCRKLAAEVVAALGGLLPFGGDSPTPFRPFYLVIGTGKRAPTKLTGDGVRTAFGGTIFPDTPIDVEAITEAEFVAQRGAEWAPFADWANRQKQLAHVSYIAIGYDTCQEPNYAAVFPRLVLGLTTAGSLVGACGTIVQA